MEEECEVKAVLVWLEIFKICGLTRFDLLDHFLKYIESGEAPCPEKLFSWSSEEKNTK